MAYYYANRIDSFGAAEVRYRTVKPMRGRYKDHDVRPLGDRRQYMERIKKISDDCYILLDWGYADDVFRTEWYVSNGNTPAVVTPEEQVMLAPIVWRRHPDGTETVTVRNATDTGQANGRYKMLQNYLPYGLTFNLTRQGAHSIYCRSEGKAYNLNLSRTVPKATYAAISAASNRRYGIAKFAQAEDDGVALTFKRTGSGTFEYVSGGTPRMVERTRIDKEAKKPLKEAINNLFTYILTMRPLLPINNYDYTKRMRDEATEWCKANNIAPGSIWGGITAKVTDASTSRALLNPEHEMYLHCAYDFMSSDMTKGMPETDEELRALRSAFTRWSNTAFKFTFKIQEAVED